MVVVYGTRYMGKIERCSGSFIATKFFHIYWMPLLPLGSHVVLEEHGDGSFRGIPAGLHLRSTLAAYLRTWGVLATLVLLFASGSSMSSMGEEGELASFVGSTALMALCALGALAGWAFLGRLSSDAKGLRLVYQDHVGHAVDPGAFDLPSKQGLRSTLLQQLLQRAPGLAASGYRSAYDPQTQWAEIGLDPSVGDLAFLSAAVTLARIESTLHSGAQAAHFARAHLALWEKLKRLNPVYLQGAALA